jgi:hypothetical protein
MTNHPQYKLCVRDQPPPEKSNLVDSKFPKVPGTPSQVVELPVTLLELDGLNMAVLGYVAAGCLSADEGARMARLSRRLEAALSRLHLAAGGCHG